MLYTERVIKLLVESRKRGGDDFDIVERASLSSMVPFLSVKQIYDRLRVEEKHAKTPKPVCRQKFTFKNIPKLIWDDSCIV